MINIDDVVRLVASELSETDKSTISGATVLRELDEWSSLFAVNLMCTIGQEINVSVEFYDFIDCETIEDLFNRIYEKILLSQSGYRCDHFDFDWDE